MDHLDKSTVVYRIYLFAIIIIFQINLCFQKIAAEVLGIKLTKNEMEQQSVSFCNLGDCSEDPLLNPNFLIYPKVEEKLEGKGILSDSLNLKFLWVNFF